MKRVSAFVMAMVFALGFSFGFVLPVSMSVQATTYEEPIFMSTQFVDYNGGISIRGGDVVRPVLERIDFHRREIEMFAMNPNMPIYMSGFNCGVTAGGSKIAFYQRIHRELIPGHNPGVFIGPHWAWTSGPLVTAMFNELHGRMGGGIGVTIDQYWIGIAGYAMSRGLGFELGHIHRSDGTLRPSFFTAIHNNQPVSLFLNGFNIISNIGFNLNASHDIISFVEYAGRHIMVAYGYRILSYFDENDVMFRQDIYLNVHTAFSSIPRAFIRINTHSTLETALVTHIRSHD